MAKKVVIDGIEYVPKSYVPIGIVSGGSVKCEYDQYQTGPGSKLYHYLKGAKYTAELTLATGETIDVSINEKQFGAIKEAAELCQR